ncbi:MAG: hypothetical protein K6T66_01110 [Peptococcaceae bacterium]|nr:hypothetical protein [Peptococcaceae bacterium]
MKRIVIAFIIIATLSGCTNKKIETGGDNIKLSCAKTNIPGSQIIYAPQIASIVGINENGQLLGYLEGIFNSSLYIIDIEEQNAKKLITAHVDNKIKSVVVNKSNVLWVENNDKSWVIFNMNIRDGSIMEIDKGDYFLEGGLDYPYLSLFNGDLVYNTSCKNPGEPMISQIIYYSLNSGIKEVIGEVKGDKTYLAAPSVYNGNVVWDRGEWTREMKAEVYLYNIPSKKLTMISGSRSAATTPVIWDKYVAWSTYSPYKSEVKNIEVYNIESGEVKPVTNNSPDSHLEPWGKTIGNGILTWKQNLPMNKITLYNLETGEIKTINSPTYYPEIHGNWLTWTPLKNDGARKPGIYLYKIEANAGN